MPAPDRRTVGGLLADSDALARETLLDARPEVAAAICLLLSAALVCLELASAHFWASRACRGSVASKRPDDEQRRVSPAEAGIVAAVAVTSVVMGKNLSCEVLGFCMRTIVADSGKLSMLTTS